MPQHGTGGTSQPRSSSPPTSSQSFWNEALAVPIPSLPEKRKASNASSPSSGEGHPDDSPPVKRARDGSSTPLVKAEPFAQYTNNPPTGTTLSYLPNRHEVDVSHTHGYLAGAEYAPNRFGDIGDYMRKKEIKVQTQNRDIALASASAGLPQIFQGLSFYINGNTHPPMEEIRKMILQRGGEVRPVLRSKGFVKYIIAPMLTQMKFKQFANYKVAREAWILESCKEGKLLDWTKWKLVPEGGWEDGGRKGLEGFLRGTQTDRETDTIKSDPEDLASEPAGDSIPLPTQKVQPTRPAMLLPPSRSLLAPARPSGRAPAHTASQSPATPTSSEAKPSLDAVIETPAQAFPIAMLSTAGPVAKTSVIPISPGAIKQESPAKEKLPPKVQQPEGWWEHYYSKESNEEAAKLLKNQEWRAKNTAELGNATGYIDGYYQNSRLHHLSTWKAELKVLVAAAQRQSEEQSLKAPSDNPLAPFSLANSALPRSAVTTATGGEKVIMHVDFDCFFVSCGLATRPHLKGKPSVVCHAQAGRGASSTSEIASASYEARAKGVRNGMSLGRAKALVGEELQTIPYEFDTYRRFSLAFYTVLMGYADELQAVSVDEALIDVTSAVAARAVAPEEAVELPMEAEIGDALVLTDGERERRARDPAMEIAEKIREAVRKETEGCEVSIGISHNILLAKLATRRAKPAGAYHLVPAEVPTFLGPLDVEDFPSVGYSIRQKIEEKFGTTIVEKLLDQPKGAFQKTLGPKTGDMVYGYLRGLDDRKLEPHKERKSISAEMNYGIRFRNQEQAEICVRDLAIEVSKRMKQVNAKGRLLTLKIMSRHPDAPKEPPKVVHSSLGLSEAEAQFLGHGWCETLNKSTSIAGRGGAATDDPDVLGTESMRLLRTMNLDPIELRGVGIQITKLDGERAPEREAGQGTLKFATKRTKSEHDPSASLTPVAQTPPMNDIDITPERQYNAEHGFVGSTDEDARLEVRSITPSPPASPTPAPREPITNQLDIEPAPIPGPSSEGIDPEFLAALPADLRLEVKRDFARERSRAVSENPLPDSETKITTRASTISPAKAQGKHAAAHITRQLRPKLKTQLKAAAVADLPLYGAWARNHAAEADAVDLTGVSEVEEKIGGYMSSELKELGIDPAVFSELPPELQKEIVQEERQRHKQRRALHRPADTSRLRQKERGRSGSRASRSPSRAGSRAGSLPPAPAVPRVTITRPARPALLKAMTLPEVLDTITNWIESRKGGGPAKKDSNKVLAYFVKCMQPDQGMAGVEMVVEGLKWMRSVIRERYRDGETDGPGREWWVTWEAMRREVDGICCKRFGAGLRF